MLPSSPRSAATVLALLLAMGGPAGAAAPPEPAGYRLSDYRAPTPDTLAGATVLTTPAAEALWRQGAAFIDVMPQPPRPAGLAPGTLWRAVARDSIPGAHWLANTGFGELSPETAAAFAAGLAGATGDDRGRALVFFCLRACWMSWNAAKRALALGYRAVNWYPDGTDGWSEAGLPLQRLEPAP
jgi:PQQ-dependent catabolism-associated CXXCW motif protein